MSTHTVFSATVLVVSSLYTLMQMKVSFLITIALAAATFSSFQDEALVSVRGVVRDAEDAAIAEATLVLVPEEDGRIRAAGSDENGFFQMPDVETGQYVLWIAVEGFEVQKRRLVSNQDTQLEPMEIVLERASGSEASLVPSSEADRFNEATIQLQAGKPALALEIFQSFLDTYPYLVRVHYNVGLCKVELADGARFVGKWEKAEELELAAQEHFRVVLERYPRFTGALEATASCLIRLGRMAEAAEALAEVLEIEPEDPQLWYNYGEVRIYLGDLPGAAKAFQRTIMLDNGFADAYAKLGAVFMNQGNYNQAIELFEKFLRLDPESNMAPYTKELLQECNELLRKQQDNSNPGAGLLQEAGPWEFPVWDSAPTSSSTSSSNFMSTAMTM